jgi:hypothetical protein
MLSLKYSLNECTCLIWFEFETWFEFDLKSLEKIKIKAIRNLEKKGKLNSAQASLVQPIKVTRALLPPDRWAPPVSGGFLPRALSSPLPQPSGPDCRCKSPSPTRHLSLSALQARLVSTVSYFPRTPAPSLSLCTVGPPYQLCLPREPPWTSEHARREPHSRRLPTHPISLLSTAHTHSLSPASFRASSPSLALCSCRSRSPEFHARRVGHPARQKLRQATPSSVPR